MYGVNDILTMKKPHPCGGRDWEVVRLGVDVKLRCTTCGKFVNLTRDEIKKRVKEMKKMNQEKE
ncbi:MAG: DUF951 domain-containing protein [Clostridiales bacterium]|nr:DUF951 domain-containing protein [Clostridiales bacterium]